MSIIVTIGTTSPEEGLLGKQGRRVRTCSVAAIPRVGEHLELDEGSTIGRFTITEVRHRPKSTERASDLNTDIEEPTVHVETVAWELD